MAAINFVKGEQYYTAEFQINGPVNVHIERAEAGALYFRQRSIDHGSYDLINGANWNNRGALTIDTAIQGVVYPMWIKIESASEPTLAEMVEGEQSGGGAGAEYVNDLITEYWAIDWDKARELGYDGTETGPTSFSMMLKVLISACSIGRVEMNGSPIIIGYPSQYCILGLPTYISSIGFAKIKIWDVDNGWLDCNSFQDAILSFQGTHNMSEIFTLITKEEFYQGVEEA